MRIDMRANMHVVGDADARPWVRIDMYIDLCVVGDADIGDADTRPCHLALPSARVSSASMLRRVAITFGASVAGAEIFQAC